MNLKLFHLSYSVYKKNLQKSCSIFTDDDNDDDDDDNDDDNDDDDDELFWGTVD